MIECFKCNSSGFIVAEQIETKLLYTFRCICPIATRKGLSAMIPQWHEGLNKKYKHDYDTIATPHESRAKKLGGTDLKQPKEPAYSDDDSPF